MLKLIFMASLLESWEMEIMTLSRPMILKQRIRSLESLLNILALFQTYDIRISRILAWEPECLTSIPGDSHHLMN